MGLLCEKNFTNIKKDQSTLILLNLSNLYKKLFLRVALLLISLISFHFVCAQQNEYRGYVDKNPPNKLNFQLFPNPYTGSKLYIASDHSEIKNIMIINILGEVIFQTSTYDGYITPHNLRSGIYIIKIKQGAQQGLSRLVVP